ncbi:hypothetical protein GPJ56_008233 [Histomonas meleagridis]|uniref:uncharacterized protein n=1 Tax=Histomonas meleagridis TaxID=135588 RepID=UPI00355938DA|nr:hypothetical protein GPJ56_008233 [Histomonas meleagridis]KAH0797254.1 hypothetical protein GO595_009936 [Histomonas meleagridis]
MDNTGLITAIASCLNYEEDPGISELYCNAVRFISTFTYCDPRFEEVFRHVNCVEPIIYSISQQCDINGLKDSFNAINNLLESFSSIDEKYNVFLNHFYDLFVKYCQADLPPAKFTVFCYVITKYGKDIEESYPLFLELYTEKIAINSFSYILYSLQFMLRKSDVIIHQIFKSSIIQKLVEFYIENQEEDDVYRCLSFLVLTIAEALSKTNKVEDEELKSIMRRSFITPVDFKIISEMIESPDTQLSKAGLKFIIQSLPDSLELVAVPFLTHDKLTETLFDIMDTGSIELKEIAIEALLKLTKCSHEVQEKFLKYNISDEIIDYCESDIPCLQMPMLELILVLINELSKGGKGKKLMRKLASSGIVKTVFSVESENENVRDMAMYLQRRIQMESTEPIIA